jgi:hypothetical protein
MIFVNWNDLFSNRWYCFFTSTGWTDCIFQDKQFDIYKRHQSKVSQIELINWFQSCFVCFSRNMANPRVIILKWYWTISTLVLVIQLHACLHVYFRMIPNLSVVVLLLGTINAIIYSFVIIGKYYILATVQDRVLNFEISIDCLNKSDPIRLIWNIIIGKYRFYFLKFPIHENCIFS